MIVCVTCPKINWRFECECENENAWHAYQLGIIRFAHWVLVLVVVVRHE